MLTELVNRSSAHCDGAMEVARSRRDTAEVHPRSTRDLPGIYSQVPINERDKSQLSWWREILFTGVGGGTLSRRFAA